MANARFDKKTVEGEDTDLAWNDQHMRYVYQWLIENELSPYKGSPAMLLTAMDVDRLYWSELKKGFKKGKLYIRFSVRIRLTAKFKLVIDGNFRPRVERKDKLGRITKYSILPVSDPQPLPIPRWITGGISFGKSGIQLLVRGAVENFAPRHDPQGRERLANPFGRR